MEFINWMRDGGNLIGQNGMGSIFLYLVAWNLVVYLAIGVVVRLRLIVILTWPLYLGADIRFIRSQSALVRSEFAKRGFGQRRQVFDRASRYAGPRS